VTLINVLDDTELAVREERQWPGRTESASRGQRTAARRDRDRILYASALQRLAYVTQVTAPEAGHAFHNRLSHSLKVAQVGRRNAERLIGLAESGEITGSARDLVQTIDPDSVEAACLAHDLGHPPFGHIAEMALHEEAQGHVGDTFDAFEGNAQTFRILTRLAVRDGENPGLNLTRQTLDGVLKYPWPHSKDPSQKANRKWGYYGDDHEAFEFLRPTGYRSQAKRRIEAEIMDWADDLTYAVHDVDDFFRAGLIPLHRLQEPKSSELEALRDRLTEARDAEPAAFPRSEANEDYGIDELVDAVRQPLSLYGPRVAYDHTIAERARMREFGSRLITRYLDAFQLAPTTDPTSVLLEIDPAIRREVEALKLLVRVFVIRRPGLGVVQHGQDRVIRSLFKKYFEASSRGRSGDRRLFPPGAKERLERVGDTAEERARVVIDLISGFTESGAIELYQRLTGGWASSRALDATADSG
jgi:dGTPase